MELTALSEITASAQTGNKAFALAELIRAGMCVPDGFVLDSRVYDAVLRENHAQEKVNDLLQTLTMENAAELSRTLSAHAAEFVLPQTLRSAVEQRLKPGVAYAVRSSGLMEDLAGFSFAGQYETVIDVSGIDAVADAICTCYRSLFSETVLTYLANHHLSGGTLRMAVIVQELVRSEISGVMFSVNPVSGCDKEALIEVAQGQGEALVSGQVSAEQYRFNWFDDKLTERGGTLLTDAQVAMLGRQALAIQLHFGYPCDIEFAFADDVLWILQARAITKLQYGGIREQWTTADFKDGGVSATICRPYMWSLYEYIWESEFHGFLVESKILRADQLGKLGEMFYARPYWNLSVAKRAMAKVPGYKERDFDNELGVAVTYEGDGETTRITPGSVFGIVRMALMQKKIVAERKKQAQALKDDLLGIYQNRLRQLDEMMSPEALKTAWSNLIFTDYLKSEGTYFRQIFINMIHQSLFRDTILKHTDRSGYFRLIGGLDHVSHLLPFYDMWEITRDIRSDAAALSFWNTHTDEEIIQVMESGGTDGRADRVRAHISTFGYHSEKELDVAYPCFAEDVPAVVRAFRDTLALADDCSPIADRERLKTEYQQELETIGKRTGARTYKKLCRKIDEMRSMLWWREEFRDVSTRFYYLIRLYTLRLAEVLCKEGVLMQEADIWFTKIADVQDYLDGKTDVEALRAIIARNRQYYHAFRNYMSENEIGRGFDHIAAPAGSCTLSGIGCSNGMITGTARVIGGLEETDRLQVGDILITRFTDTGWTSKFALLGGIVTEYGGILCHAAIVSREYGIPCIVCADGATTKIPDGARITINGETGAITILE